MRAKRLFEKDRPLLQLLLFLLTLASTFATFFLVFQGGHSDGPLSAQLWGSALFSLSLCGILGAHEMGHYVFARYHRVESSLPWFIPLPLLGFGTMGPAEAGPTGSPSG